MGEVYRQFPALFPYLRDTFFADNSAGRTAMIFLGIITSIAVAYLLGSVNFGILLSKRIYHDDIRDHGSGNAGTTNMLRVYGKKTAALTLALDILKGMAAVILGALLASVNGAYIAGFFVVLGHMFPLFFKFKGGKGVATTLGAIIVISPIVAAILLAVFIIIFLGSHYVSLASVMTALLYPLILNAMNGPGVNVIMAVLTAGFIVFMHRANIKRLYHGQETKTYLRKREEAGTVSADEKKEPKNGPESDGTDDDKK